MIGQPRMIVIRVRLTRLASGVIEARPVVGRDNYGTNILRGRSITNKDTAESTVKVFYAQRMGELQFRLEWEGLV